MLDDKATEEILEFIWTEREKGQSSINRLIGIGEVAEAGADRATLEAMAQSGLVRIDGDSVVFTAVGEKRAEGVIRNHRLAERLFTEVLALDEDAVEKNACSFEHTLSSEVTDSICTLLGHPPACPHGLLIPRGECCKKADSELKPIVKCLSEVEPGDLCRIIFIVSSSNTRLDKLSTLGLVPGSMVRLKQRRPAFVVQIGETTIALDPAIAKEIYVKRLTPT